MKGTLDDPGTSIRLYNRIIAYCTCIIRLVRGSVMTFRSSGPSSPVTMFKLSTTASDMSLITPVTASSGSNTNTDSQLKQSCTVAPAKALEQTHTESVIEELQTFYWWLNADSMRYCMLSLPFELLSLPCLYQSHDGVGDRCADVWAHDDRNCGSNIQHCVKHRTQKPDR